MCTVLRTRSLPKVVMQCGLNTPEVLRHDLWLACWLGMAGRGVEATSSNFNNDGYPFMEKRLDARQSLGTL